MGGALPASLARRLEVDPSNLHKLARRLGLKWAPTSGQAE